MIALKNILTAGLLAVGLPGLLILTALIVQAKSLSAAELQKVDRYLEQTQKNLNLPSMSATIVSKNKVLLSKTYGRGTDIDTPYIIGSNTKSFTGIVVMTLVEKGRLDPNAKISAYLDNLSYGDKITVRQLLHHTGGLNRDGDIDDAKIIHKQGETHYSNIGYRLLGKIIEKSLWAILEPVFTKFI